MYSSKTLMLSGYNQQYGLQIKKLYKLLIYRVLICQ